VRTRQEDRVLEKKGNWKKKGERRGGERKGKERKGNLNASSRISGSTLTRGAAM